MPMPHWEVLGSMYRGAARHLEICFCAIDMPDDSCARCGGRLHYVGPVEEAVRDDVVEGVGYLDELRDSHGLGGQ